MKITERDKQTAAEVNLGICPKCGWYGSTLPNDGIFSATHFNRCNPEAGKHASALIEALPDIESGKLGYGDGLVVFDLDENFNVRFSVDSFGAFSLEEVFLLKDMNAAAAESLVRALQAWKQTIK